MLTQVSHYPMSFIHALNSPPQHPTHFATIHHALKPVSLQSRPNTQPSQQKINGCYALVVAWRFLSAARQYIRVQGKSYIFLSAVTPKVPTCITHSSPCTKITSNYVSSILIGSIRLRNTITLQL